MSAFEKRVALVEKWHTDLTKSLDDMYDLAEQVLDVWQEAEAHTEERIIKLLESPELHDTFEKITLDFSFPSGELIHQKSICQDTCTTCKTIELIKGETNG